MQNILIMYDVAVIRSISKQIEKRLGGHLVMNLKLECAVDGAPLKILTLFANVANSMTDGLTCSSIPLPRGEVM